MKATTTYNTNTLNKAIMKRFYIYKKIFVLISILLISFINGGSALFAQTYTFNYGYGFESTLSPWTDDGGNTEVVTSTKRTGTKSAYHATTTSSGKKLYYDINLNYAANTYVHFIIWTKKSSTANTVTSTVEVYLGSTGSSNQITATTSWQRNSCIRTKSSASTSNQIRNYRGTTTSTDTLFTDDIIVYTSSTNVPTDLNDPNAPSSPSASHNGTNALITWSNGGDNTSSGYTDVQATLVLKYTGTGTPTAPTLNDQAIYAVNDVPATDWIVVKIDGGTTGTNVDVGAVAAGTKYVLYHRDLAYNWSAATAVLTASASCNTPVKTYNVTATSTSICNGSSTTIGLSDTESGVTYELLAGGSSIGAGVTMVGDGNAKTFAAQSPSTTTTYTVRTTTAGGYCQAVIDGGTTSSQVVTVNATSVGGTTSGASSICSGSNPGSDITLSGHTGSITKWQKSTASDFSVGPTDIVSTANPLTAGTIGALTTTTYFRAVVTSGVCAAANSAGTAVTVKAAPTNPPTGTTAFSGTTDTGTTWGTITKGADADGTIIFCRATSSNATDPANGTDYTANTTFGSGTEIASSTGWFCVYKGTAANPSVSVTGLTASTTYHFKAYSYNCTGAGILYNMTEIVDDETTTAACAAPSSAPDGTPTFSGTSSSATTWGTFSNDASSDNTIVFCREGGTTADNPVDGTAYTASTNWSAKGTQIGSTGWYCVYKGSASGASVTMTNLSASTAYYFKAYAYNDCSSSPKYYTAATLAGNETTDAAPAGCPIVGYDYNTSSYPNTLPSNTNANFGSGTTEHNVLTNVATSSLTICNTSSITGLNIGSNTTYVEIALTGNSSTSEFTSLTLTGSSNSTTANTAKAGIVFSDEYPFNMSSVIGAFSTDYFPKSDASWADVSVTIPAGTKSIRIYRQIYYNSGTGAASTSSGSGFVLYGLGQTVRLASVKTCVSSPCTNPTVSTQAVSGTSAATPTTATGNGTIDNIGDGVTTSGICWKTSTGPTISDSKTTDGPTTAESFTGSMTGLTPNTTYYVKAYASYSGCSTGYGSEVTVLTYPGAPTVGSGDNATESSIRANWTAPSPAGSASYTYIVEVDDDSNFGSINSTSGSIASGTLTYTATGLSASTTYYFRVKAVNATGSSVWSATSAGYATTAPCLAPSSEPDGTPTFSSTTSTTTTWGTFSNDASSDNTIVFCRAGGTTADNPVDGTVYTASTNWAAKGTQIGSTGWYCVYKGSASGASVVMTNLTASTAYYFKAYAYNDCSSSPKYYTAATLTGNTTTDVASGTCSTRTVTFSGAYTNFVSANDVTISKTTSNSSKTISCLSGSSAAYLNFNSSTAYLLLTLDNSDERIDSVKIVWLSGTSNQYIPIVFSTGTMAAPTTVGGITEVLTATDGGLIESPTIASSSANNCPGGDVFSFPSTTVQSICLARKVAYNSSTYNLDTEYPTFYARVNSTTGTYSTESGSGSSIYLGELTLYISCLVCQAPATQVGNISFSGIYDTQLDVTVASGNDSILILAHSGAAVDADPVDDTDYTANASFGSGSQIGTNNYVVFKGKLADLPLTVTGLTASTNYHFAAYAYKDCGGLPKYRAIGKKIANQQTTAACSAPTGAPDGTPTFSGVTQTGLTWGEFTNDASSNYTIVFCREGSSTGDNPVNGTSYTASTNWNSKGTQIGTSGWYCVYKGDAYGASVAMTNLAVNTAYYFKAYSFNNCVSVTYYTGATLAGNTSTLPPNPEIKVELVSTNVDVANNATVNMGTVISGSTIDKTFRIINTDDLDALTISSATFETGTKYAFVGSSPTTASPLAAGDTVEFTLRFTPGATTGIYTDKLTIANNDNDESSFVINLSGGKAGFTIPYKYESGITAPIYKSDTLYQDYTTITDIPEEVSLNGGVAIDDNHYYLGYSVYQVEGNCMPNGSSALRIGQGANGLELDLDECGTVTVKWCSNGYRKIKISDDASNVYEVSPTYLVGGNCYTTSTVINTANPITLNIELIGPEATSKGTIYYLEITPYDAAVKSSARNIVSYSTGIAGEKVRIYEDVIFVSVPGTANLAAITPTDITPSAAATVSPAEGVTQNYSTPGTYVNYTVTAENGLTKTYKVYVEYAPTYTGIWEDSIAVEVDMNLADKLLEVLEISNTSCVVPTSGNGSAYTIYYLNSADKPSEYTIGGLSQVCIGSTVTYSIKNAPVTNNPSYTWNVAIPRAYVNEFTITNAVATKIDGTEEVDIDPGVGETLSYVDTLRTTGTTETLELLVPDNPLTAALSISIVVNVDPGCDAIAEKSSVFPINITQDAPNAVDSIEASCVNNGILTLTAKGSGASATTYGWTFSPSQNIINQSDSTIILNIGTASANITAEVVTQNGCGITPATGSLPIEYATQTSTWTGAANNEWNNHNNWNGRIPTACTNVIIPNVNSSSVNYPVISTSGICNYITFEPGAAVKGLEKLTYNKAFVKQSFARDHWYTLTAPLKEMYSGDFYFNGAPEASMKLFDTTSPDAIGPNTVYEGTFTRSFANLTTELSSGEGFAFNVSQKVWNYPSGSTTDGSVKTITLPRMNTDSSLITSYIPYNSRNGYQYTGLTKTITKDTDDAYRFALENASGVMTNDTVAIQSDFNLIGNPIMTHLNINAFLNTNATVRNAISNYVKLWTGTAYETYDGTNWDGTYTGSYIAPMQSFVVNGLSAGTVIFDLSAHFDATDGNSALRSTSVNNNKLFIKAKKDGITTGTVITNTATATNGFDNNDIYKLFTPLTEVSDVYTSTNGYALAFNKFNQYPFTAPLGIKTSAYGKVNLSFEGAESFTDAEVYLLNSLTGEQINLKEQTAYEVELTPENAQGTMFVEFRSATVKSELTSNSKHTVQIFTKDNNTVRVISSASNPIKEVTIMDEVGRTILQNKNLNQTVFDTVLNNGSKIVIVKVRTEYAVEIAKVLIK